MAITGRFSNEEIIFVEKVSCNGTILWDEAYLWKSFSFLFLLVTLQGIVKTVKTAVKLFTVFFWETFSILFASIVMNTLCRYFSSLVYTRSI